MSTQKVSLTLEERAIERARLLVGPRGLSAYVDEALHEKLDRDARRQALLDLLVECETADPASDAERAQGAARVEVIRREVGL